MVMKFRELNRVYFFARRKVKARIWNGIILLWWHRLWIRKERFHKSLDLDQTARKAMSPKKREWYAEDLDARRSIAYSRDDSMDKRGAILRIKDFFKHIVPGRPYIRP